MIDKKASHALLTNVNLSKEDISNVSPQDRRHMCILIRVEWLITELVLRCERAQPCAHLLLGGCLSS